jgi:hypothetical protein
MPRLTRTLLAAAALALLGGVASAGEQHAMANAAPAAQEAVQGAQLDVADAKAYLAQLEAGHFEGIFSMDGDTLRCGEPAANPDCQPLTDADKQAALAEAREFLEYAIAGLHEAEADYAAAGGIQSAALD